MSTLADLRRFLRAAYHDNVLRAATWTELFPPADAFAFQGRCPGFNVFMLRDPDPAEARSYAGTLRAPAGALVYGDEFEIEWRDPDLIVTRGGTAIDVLVPQGGGVFLLRTMWSELSFTAAQVTIRPLWLDNAPVNLERVAR